MKQKTLIREVIDILEQQKTALGEMEALGVLMDGELIHKSNQLTSTQLMLAKMIPLEEYKLIDFHVGVMKLGLIIEGEAKWKESYLPKITAAAKEHYAKTFLPDNA